MERQPANGALSRGSQMRILAVSGLAIAVALAVTPAIRQSLQAQPAAELPRMTTGEWHPDARQLQDIALRPATLRNFAELVTAEATVAPDDDTSTQVFSPFSGQVLAIAVRAGDHVEKGQTLMTVAANEAVQAQSDLSAAAGALLSATVAAHNAEENEKRQHALYDDGSAALKDWQQAQADQAATAAALGAAEANRAAAANKLSILGFTARQIASMQKRKPGEQLPAAPVTAPISGTIVQRLVGPGQFLQAGASTAAFTVGDLRRLWLVANVREDDAPQIKIGQAVRVTVAALPGKSFTAALTWVAPSLDPTTHRLPVRAEIVNPGGLLKPGMFSSMEIHTGSDRRSPAVPEAALIREGDSAHIWVSSEGGLLRLQPVETGRSQDGFVEILRGLKGNERVAVAGGLFLDSETRAN